MSTSKMSKNETSKEKKQAEDELVTFGFKFPNKSQEQVSTKEHKEGTTQQGMGKPREW